MASSGLSKIHLSQQKRQTHTVTMMFHPAACTKQLIFLSVCTQRQGCRAAGLHAAQSELNVLQLKKMYANRQNNYNQRKWCIEPSQPLCLHLSTLLDMSCRLE